MSFKLIIAAALFLAMLLVLLVLLLATDTALSVWSRLEAAPLWLQVGYGAVLIVAALASVLLLWRVLRPKKKSLKAADAGRPRAIDESSLEQEILDAAASGVNVDEALRELEEKRSRSQGGKIHIAICGEVSTGKSSLVSALLPDATVASDPRAGTTTEITQYRWRAPRKDERGDEIVIADLPGFNLDENEAAREECLRAHLVLFLCEGDLTASQASQLEYLRGFDKPMVLALNKADRFSEAELEQVLQRLRERSRLGAEDIVAISSGGMERVSEGEAAQGAVERRRPPDIAALLQRMQAHLDRDPELMDSLRDTAVLLLASQKLQAARRRHRDEKAEALVNRYSRRAVVGALAAVAPGSDLIIQGVLASQLLRELSAIYGVQVREIEMDSFLQLTEGKIRNMSAITLAIAGNALKAFPGLGTLTGGMVHAVAYGMIFDSLGRAAARSLSSRGELRALPAASEFEELMHENLGSGAVRFARLALDRKKDRSGD
jgi:GTP-binding protein EngB required for normal cell division